MLRTFPFSLWIIVTLALAWSLSTLPTQAQTSDVIWRQEGDFKADWGPSQKNFSGAASLNSEVADDFDVSGTITRIETSGYNSFNGGGQPTLGGVYVRFYSYDPAGTPGPLQAEYFVPAGDPRLVYSASNPSGFDLTLSPAFQATGKHFLAVQPVMDANSNAYYYPHSSNTGASSGQVLYYRDPLHGRPDWSHTVYSLDGSPFATANSDIAFTLHGTRALGVPVLSSLSSATAPQAGRFRITGSGFGPLQKGSVVKIGNAIAPVSRWSETAITAYVPDGAAPGSDPVQVVTSGGASNSLTLLVTSRPAATARVKWRFLADDSAIRGRPAVGADGTVYALDTSGRLYAVSPGGGVKWIFNGGGGNASQPVSVGNDGTIYFASIATIFAVRPDGTLKWKFSDPGSAIIFAGPTVGPDGNIYACSSDLDIPNGLGAFVLSPAGTLISNLPGFSVRFGYGGIEVVFASGHWYFTNNASGAVAPAGSLWAFNLGGTTLVWHQSAERQPRIQLPNNNIVVGDGNRVHPGLFDYTSAGGLVFHVLGEGTPIDTQTDVDLDSSGNIYLGTLAFGTGSHFRSLNPNGTPRWQFRDDDIATSPAVSPLNTLVLYSAAGTGAPSHVNALNTANGALLWRENLPAENGANVQVASIPRFATDGSTAYVGTTVPGASSVYCYLYAFITGSNGLYAADGIDDAWQVQYFGQNNPQADPNADPDGDGRTNLQEFIEGTIPTDPNSHFSLQVLSVVGQPGQKKIIFSPLVAGRTYLLECAAPGSQNWYTPSGTSQSDVGSVRTITDSSAHGGSCVYRVRSSRP